MSDVLSLLPKAIHEIRCGNESHQLAWSRGAITTLDHADPDGERTLAALGHDRVTMVGHRWDSACIELRQLYLLDEAKGTGIALALTDWAVAEARRRGAVELWLSVFSDNPRARRFYERYGFKEVGEFKFMVGNHADDEFLCRLKLDA